MVFEIQDGVLQNCRLTIGETEAVIPEGVKSIGDRAFYRSLGLQSIMIPESVTSIGKEAFTECRKLQSIHIPESVTSIGEKAFSYCISLRSIIIPESVSRRSAQKRSPGAVVCKASTFPKASEALRRGYSAVATVFSTSIFRSNWKE